MKLVFLEHHFNHNVGGLVMKHGAVSGRQVLE